MRKILSFGAIALFGIFNSQTTSDFKVGAHIGLPVGDAADGFSLLAGADVAYMWPITIEFNLGFASGYSAWFGKSVEVPGYGKIKGAAVSMIPFAGAAEYKFSPQFSLGVDLGYALILASEVSDGGFYYQPKAAYHFGANQIYVGYVGLSKNGYSSNAVTLGYAHSFMK